MKTLAFSLLLALSAPAFAQTYGHVQSTGQHDVRVASVLHVGEVRLQASRTGTGSNIGAQAGYAIGRELGGNYTAEQIARQLGRQMGQNAEARRWIPGTEVLVRDQRGRVFSVVQEGRLYLTPGEKVAIVGYGRQTRVVRLDSR